MSSTHAAPSRTLSSLTVAGVLLFSAGIPAAAQTATIREEVRVLETYPFSDPDPTPILIRDPRLYPYHAFDGYSHESEPQPWKVVTLENEYIEVFVLPEVGGKVWGARIKATGDEFIYRNEVMKFRNIALRGPWTSGGIEFNFGVIGHSPATATPVDYVLQREADGGVSCTVGSIDLPSRTPWRVKILLPADSACFETQVLWYNPTPLEQPYYNWMTGAAAARDDLEFFVPGDEYLKHSGEAKRWPFDEERRKLSVYDQNRFGGHKSYHVVGTYNDFFGGYYHDAGFGFGHWAPYEDMPGQKLWLWALSREGGVWEQLLTDTDGQYIEFQAGRQLVQYARGSHQNPIREAVFEPFRVDRWTERWFPLLGLGGMTEASEYGAMNVERGEDSLRVRLHSFVPKRCTLRIADEFYGDGWVERSLELTPLEVFDETFTVEAGDRASVSIPELGLYDTAFRGNLHHGRPFWTNPAGPASMSETDRLLDEARELSRARRYGAARDKLLAILDENPWHRETLLDLAEIEYRRGRGKEGREVIERALQLDTYDPRANWIAGNLGNGKECFGWAARSTAYRAAAYEQLAEIALRRKDDPSRAVHYAERALDYDRYGIDALQVLAIARRLQGQMEAARVVLDRLLELDPLHHFAFFEQYLLNRSDETLHRFTSRVGGEFPDQTYLELAITYERRGRYEEAEELLSARVAEGGPLIGLWVGFGRLGEDPDEGDRLIEEALARSPAFVFPFRREMLEVLEYVAAYYESWKADYYFALNLWALDRAEEAARLLEELGDEPDFAPFYTTRAHLLHELEGRDPEPDLRRAAELDPARWQTTKRLIDYLQSVERWEEAETLAREARAKFPDNFQLELTHARALLELGTLDECVEIVEAVKVLPSEMGRFGRQLFEWAHVARAIERLRAEDFAGAAKDVQRSLEWPEHLGVGRPHEPEERLQRYLLSTCRLRMAEVDAARDELQRFYAALWARPGDDLFLLLRVAAEAQYTGGPIPLAVLWKDIRNSAKIGEPELSWLDAVIRDDRETVAKLEEEHPQCFSSIDCRLLREAFEVTVGGRR